MHGVAQFQTLGCSTTTLMNLRFLLIPALIFLSVQANAQERDDSLDRVITVADCSEIYVQTQTGWWLIFRPDGSARLGFGSSGGDDVSLPVQSFLFPEIHRKLAALKFDGIGLSRDPSVAFEKRGATGSYGLSTSDHKAIKELFQMVREKVKDFDSEGRLASIWAANLPTP